VDDTALRLHARVSILGQLIVRLFALMGAEHVMGVKAIAVSLAGC